MKNIMSLVLMVLLVNISSMATAQVAGKMPLGLEEMTVIARGWSVRNDILGKAVINEEGKSIGEVTDLIVTPTRFVSYAIIGVGGFLGFKVYDVAVPMNYLKIKEAKIILPGATKEALEKMPPFRYTK